MAEDLRDTLNQALGGELDAAMSRIAHCLTQLTDEQLWWRPRADMNAIANLVLHLVGNVQQMVVDNLTGAPDTRDRPAEFAARDSVSSDQLLGMLITTVRRARAAILSASDERVRSIAHFRGHTQEIIHLTRTILGDKYQYAGPK
jgi:hypothetical protein